MQAIIAMKPQSAADKMWSQHSRRVSDTAANLAAVDDIRGEVSQHFINLSVNFRNLITLESAHYPYKDSLQKTNSIILTR